MHKLICITKDRLQYDVTPLVGSIRWSTDTETMAAQMDIVMAPDRIPYARVNPCDVGNMIVLSGNQGEMFRGFLVTETRDGAESISYHALDHGFYLTQSQGLYKFKGVTVTDAIKKILTDFSIPVGSVLQMNTKVTHIYGGSDSLVDIIKDLLKMAKDETGEAVNCEMREGKFYIEKRTGKIITGSVVQAENLAAIDVLATTSAPKRKRSIEEMGNIIKVVSEEAIKAQARDEALIGLYGKLQKIISIDKKDSGQAAQIAKTKLKELGRIAEDVTVDFLGDDRFRAGRQFQYKDSATGAAGLFDIKACEHDIGLVSGLHKMSLKLGVPHER